MKHGDDYLWDRSGKPDPTVQKLEQMLSGFAHDGRELAGTPPGRVLRNWPVWVVLAAASGLTITLTLMWPEPVLQPGGPSRTFVAQNEPIVVPLGNLAEITLAPGSELRFEHWRQDEALFRLERGMMSARVEPPPAVAPDFFLVDTEFGRVTDKGCRYELRIESDGTHVVDVTEGAVTFAFPARTVFVPAGAQTRVTARGPSTPLFDGSTIEVQNAVKRFDGLTQKGEAPERTKRMFEVIQVCTDGRDSLVLWHLLRDDDEEVRQQAEAALIDLVGPPLEEPPTKGPRTWDPEIWLAFLRLGPWMQAR